MKASFSAATTKSNSLTSSSAASQPANYYMGIAFSFQPLQ